MHKTHFKTLQEIKFWTNEEAAKIVAADRESSQRDLFDAIERGDYPKWRFCIQVMTEQEAANYRINPFDLTKVWPHADYPLIEVGILELNRNPENYFAEIEQAAFEPSNVVPGIGFSPDRMLQARIMSYADAHRYRIGVNYAHLPVNKPRCPYHTYHRDGNMRLDDYGGGSVNYEPNSFGGPAEDHSFGEPPLKIMGDADRYDHRKYNEDYEQPGNLYRLMYGDEKARLVSNIADAMDGVPERIRMRQAYHFHKADSHYGESAAKSLGLDMSKLKALLGMSLEELFEATSEEGFAGTFPAKKAAVRK